MKTSIIILTYNKLDYSKQCIESIRTYTDKEDYELIIIDNNSIDGTVDWLKQQKDINCIFNDENVGFPKGCNQGIKIAQGDNILLLNNDVVVTENWLSNLLCALYSDPSIGAVGPVTNSASYFTSIETSYKSLNEMHEFARGFNNANSSKWEERLKLIGYCMLIKKDAIEKIGLLDEQFSPGNFEDDDLSVRLRKGGYKLLLCRDTFIHHYGSVSWKDNINEFSQIISLNEKKFMAKWGTNSQSYVIHFDLIEQLDFPKDQELVILHIGCQSGGTLLELKNRYKNAKLYGLDTDPYEGREAELFSEVVIGDIEESLKSFGNQFFDLVLVTNWEQIKDREVLIETMNFKLKNNGLFLTSMKNIANYQIIRSILLGSNPIQSEYFSLKEIHQLFKEKGFVYKIRGISNHLDQMDKQMIDGLCLLAPEGMRDQFEIFNYIVRLNKINSPLLQLIFNIKEEINIKESVLKLGTFEVEEVIGFIKSYFKNPIEYLHAVSISHFNMDMHDNVIPYLQAAYELDPDNKDTIYNIAFTLNVYGQNDLAKTYLEKTQRDQDLQELYNKIENEIANSKRELTFLIRRLEHNINLEKTKELLLSYLKRNLINENDIYEIVDNDITNKIEVLNHISILCFENNLNDFILPLLKKAYDLDPINDDTLFNLGYVLVAFGEEKIALNYLEKINNKDQDVLEIINGIKGVVSVE